jgi:enoyl-CoA hydratase/carnithine racemase
VTAEIDFAADQGVLTIVLERPPGNMWNARMLDAAMQRIRAAAEDPVLFAIRLRARGDVFCLGRERGARDASDLRSEARRLADMLQVWTSTPLLTLAEVNGDAAGFGANLAGLADFAIAADTARLSFPEIRGGLAPTLVLSWLPSSVGHTRAMQLVTTGEPLEAATGCDWGLLTRVVPRAELEATADDVVATWRGFDKAVLRDIKQFVVRTRYWPPDRAADMAVDALALSALAGRGQDPPAGPNA